MVKEVELTKSKVTIVDDEDYESVSGLKWYAQATRRPDKFYAGTNLRNSHPHRIIYMHQVIMQPPVGMAVDHVNDDGLDNRRCNLRICTYSQNKAAGRKQSTNTSGYRGVSFNAKSGRWVARLYVNRMAIEICECDTAREAALLYNLMAKAWYGEFAYLNEVNGRG